MPLHSLDRDANEEFAQSGAARVEKAPKRALRSAPPPKEDYRLPGESTTEAALRRQNVSKRNINGLLAWKPASARDLRVESRWLKRFCEKGLAYPTAANRSSLLNAAAFFGLSGIDEFWEDDLLKRMRLPGPTETQVQAWRASRHWGYAEKLLHLLDDGCHSYLATLIDELYDLELRRSADSPKVPPAEAMPMAEYIRRRKQSSSGQ